MFDNIAPDYDKLNHILSLNIDKNWRKKAVRELADEARPLNVLDVACGTGDFTIENNVLFNRQKKKREVYMKSFYKESALFSLSMAIMCKVNCLCPDEFEYRFMMKWWYR